LVIFIAVIVFVGTQLSVVQGLQPTFSGALRGGSGGRLATCAWAV